MSSFSIKLESMWI